MSDTEQLVQENDLSTNSVQAEPVDNAVMRAPNGTLLPGSKLGKGRKKGSKNKATLMREAMERKTSIQISKLAPKVLKKVGEQAIKEGCRTSQKMILDRAVPIRKAEDDSGHQQATVEIVITNLTRENAAERLGHGVIIEGECETE